ncbi:hypothetical protein ACIRNI_11405 [Streptomyces sp. NPDC093546]|uniref:hypothetical protein n=1 Tax=Streptomyces sp. NPDC093546 TaxID=3366040 RepID=UPI00381785F3
MRERVTKAAWWLVTGGATAWGAAQTTRGVELGGPAGRQVAVVLIVLALGLLALLPGRALKHGLPRLVRTDAVRRHEGPVSCLLSVTMVGGVLVLGPMQWWLAEAVCGLLGLPLRIAGFWSYVAAAVVELFLGIAVTALRGSLTAKGRAEGAVGRLGRLLVCFGVLWLLAQALGGVRLETDEGWRSLLALTAMAVLLSALGTGYTLSHDLGWPALRPMVLGSLPLLAAGSVAGGALALWLVSWFSTALRPTLHVSGLGTFLLGGLIAAALMWTAGLPFFLYGLKRRGLSLSQGRRAAHPYDAAYPYPHDAAYRPLAVRGTGFGYVWPAPRKPAAPAVASGAGGEQ